MLAALGAAAAVGVAPASAAPVIQPPVAMMEDTGARGGDGQHLVGGAAPTSLVPAAPHGVKRKVDHLAAASGDRSVGPEVAFLRRLHLHLLDELRLAGVEACVSSRCQTLSEALELQKKLHAANEADYYASGSAKSEAVGARVAKQLAVELARHLLAAPNASMAGAAVNVAALVNANGDVGALECALRLVGEVPQTGCSALMRLASGVAAHLTYRAPFPVMDGAGAGDNMALRAVCCA